MKTLQAEGLLVSFDDGTTELRWPESGCYQGFDAVLLRPDQMDAYFVLPNEDMQGSEWVFCGRTIHTLENRRGYHLVWVWRITGGLGEDEPLVGRWARARVETYPQQVARLSEALAKVARLTAPVDVEKETAAITNVVMSWWAGPGVSSDVPVEHLVTSLAQAVTPIVEDRARLVREVGMMRQHIAAMADNFDRQREDLVSTRAENARLTSNINALAADVGQALCAATLRPGETITDQHPHAIVSLVVGLMAENHALAAEVARLTTARDNLQAEVSMLVGGLNDIFGASAHPSPREALEQVSGLVRRLRTAAPGEAWDRLCNAVGCLRGWPDEDIADAVKAFDAYRASVEPRGVGAKDVDPIDMTGEPWDRITITVPFDVEPTTLRDGWSVMNASNVAVAQGGVLLRLGASELFEAIIHGWPRWGLDGKVITSAPEQVEPIDAEDLWTDYRTERLHLTASDRLVFLEGVAAGWRTASPPEVRLAPGKWTPPTSPIQMVFGTDTNGRTVPDPAVPIPPDHPAMREPLPLPPTLVHKVSGPSETIAACGLDLLLRMNARSAVTHAMVTCPDCQRALATNAGTA